MADRTNGTLPRPRGRELPRRQCVWEALDIQSTGGINGRDAVIEE